MEDRKYYFKFNLKVDDREKVEEIVNYINKEKYVKENSEQSLVDPEVNISLGSMEKSESFERTYVLGTAKKDITRKIKEDFKEKFGIYTSRIFKRGLLSKTL